tara:strand:+ start:1671 stop:2660 length:990 start_codon:yes stop_codon:yes gene_type:complete
MGLLVDGKWVDKWYDTDANKGRFERQASLYRNWITPDGSPGPDGGEAFPAEAGRYHLIVSLACPWAHRTLIFRAIKGLEDLISVSVVQPLMLENGWEFSEDGDPLYGARFLHEFYTRVDPQATTRVTVPVLWDKQRETIVNNESAEIIRMLNSAFDHLTGNRDDYYPESLRSGIDAINKQVYDTVNNGVYRAGFATTQEAYEEAYEALFATLDELDQRLAENRYLLGERITEADWRLFTTLVRFDAVYFGHFKTNRQRIEDFAHLSGYLRDLYQQPGVADTLNMTHIKQHYYGSHRNINPTGIVPLGPHIDFSRPHARASLAAASRTSV